jgi:CRP-like cAMP-binding protein
VPDIPVRVEFLKKSHLFRGLSDDELTSAADAMKETTFDEAGTVFVQGSSADSFYIIFQGRVHLTRRVKDKEIKIASLVKGDYFGEAGLLKGTSRNATVKADAGTVLLILYRDNFKQLLKKVPGLWANFDIMMDSRRLANQLRFKWLAENEVIYFLARKHIALLVRVLALPVLILIPTIALLALAYVTQLALIGLIGGFAFVADLAWCIWNFVDWGNDYYIVTNQRVIWLEKVVALYDSRTEAGMGTILSVGTESDYWGRVFDYGTVIVRTFTGQIRMDYVVHPRQAAGMIEEYWNRTKEVSRRADEEIMKDAIRAKLGVKKPLAAPAPPPVPAKPARKPLPWETWWKNAFRVRIETGNVVTYHKHVFVLFRDEFMYVFGILLLLVSIPGWPFIFESVMPGWLVTMVLFIVLVLCGFVVYEYIDWANDIYQVTPEQIIDVYKKPFGTEDRKAAPLENILSSEYKREGILGMLFNFGTVFIMVGGAKFDFVDVADPPSVQQDIVRRQQARLLKKRETDSAAERERIADWLAMYHRTLEEMEREKNQSRPSNPE